MTEEEKVSKGEKEASKDVKKEKSREKIAKKTEEDKKTEAESKQKKNPKTPKEESKEEKKGIEDPKEEKEGEIGESEGKNPEKSKEKKPEKKEEKREESKEEKKGMEADKPKDQAAKKDEPEKRDGESAKEAPEKPAGEGRRQGPRRLPERRGERDGESAAQVEWKPKTKLGRLVESGKITTMHEVMSQPSPIKEVEIVDKLLPAMQEEILNVGRVQRVTDSGRRMRFRVVTAVGNSNGYVGIGESKGKEAGPTIRKSIERAKLSIQEIKRGCGSWECGCGNPHTVPFRVQGKSGSVVVTLKPAPRGVGIVSGEIAKTILSLAGIKDVWVTTEGHSRTAINFAHAVIFALKNTNYVKLKGKDAERLNIVTGQAKQEDKPAPDEAAT